MGTRFLCYLAGILIGLCISFVYVYAQHGSWQDRYRSTDGTLCCGRTDCQAVPVSIVTHDGTLVQAMVLGIKVTVPAKSVHQSEEQQSYWCRSDPERPPADDNVRCLFVVTGS